MSKRQMKEIGRGLVKLSWDYWILEINNIKVAIERKGSEPRYYNGPKIGPHFKITSPERIYGIHKVYDYLKSRNLHEEFIMIMEERLLMST